MQARVFELVIIELDDGQETDGSNLALRHRVVLTTVRSSHHREMEGDDGSGWGALPQEEDDADGEGHSPVAQVDRQFSFSEDSLPPLDIDSEKVQEKLEAIHRKVKEGGVEECSWERVLDYWKEQLKEVHPTPF